MRKVLVIILILLWLAVLVPRLNKKICFFSRPKVQRIEFVQRVEGKSASLNHAFKLLKERKDKEALLLFQEVLLTQPENIDALWGKAEVSRRTYKYKEAEEILNQILKRNPGHAPSLISLAYIRYKEDRLDKAQGLINQVLEGDCPDKENEALANMMLGMINSRRSAKGNFLKKVTFGAQIKCFFVKAKELAPDLAEVHMGLGTFYLKAPVVGGGNLNLAEKELRQALELAPDFATANAYLAQVYKKKRDLEKYRFYFQRAQELDPQNEALKEIK